MKKLRVVYCVLFFVLCALPVVLMPLSKQDTSFAKRTASQLPALRTDDGKLNLKAGAELETYLSEHFAFRAELVTANNLLHHALFGVSREDSVITGADDWLFLADTLPDYADTNAMTARTLHNTLRTLSLMRDYAAAQGAQFLFVVPPNKNTLYPDAMPAWYRQGTDSNLTRLTAALQGTDIPYLNLADTLGAADAVVYHKRDTHWNNIGARLGCGAILNALGLPFDGADTPFEARTDWSGDLDALIYPTAGYLDTQYYDTAPAHTTSFSFTGRATSVEAPDILTEHTGDAAGKLLVFRDSFGNALLPYLSSAVGTVRYQKYVPYQLNLLEAEQYDAVVVELVERNLAQLTEQPPVLPAAAVTLSGTAT